MAAEKDKTERDDPEMSRAVTGLSTEGRKLIGQAIIDGILEPGDASINRFETAMSYFQIGGGNYTQSGGGNHQQTGGGNYTQSAIMKEAF